MMDNTKKRFGNIDIIKAIGMFWVISLHVDVWHVDFISGNRLSGLLQYAFRIIAEGVPIFMMINGYLTFRSSSFSLKKHIRKMAKIFVLIIVWAVILTVIQSIGNEPLSLGLIAECVLNTWVGSKYTGVLWFLQGLLAVYFLYPVLKYVYDNNKTVFVYLFAVTSFFTIGIHLLDLFLQLLYFIHPSVKITLVVPFLRRFEPYNFDQNASYVFFAMLGGMIAFKEEDIRKNRWKWTASGMVSWMLALGMGVLLSTRYGYVYNPAFNFCSVFMAVLLVGLFAFVRKDKEYTGPGYRFLESLGRNSFGIYLSHFIFIHILNKTVPGGIYAFPSLWQRLLVLTAVYLLSWCFSLIIGRIPYVKTLIIT